MFRNLAATACLSAAIVASLAGGASAKGSTWAATPDGSTWLVTAQVHGNTTTWTLTPVKKASIPAGVKFTLAPLADRKLGITKVAGAALMTPSSIKLG